MIRNNPGSSEQVDKEVVGWPLSTDRQRVARATEILKSLSEMLKRRGYQQSTFEEMWRRGNRFEIHGMYAGFRIRERTTRKRNAAGKPIEPPTFENTGILELKMECNAYSDSWIDRKSNPLEMQLEGIVAGIESKSLKFEAVQREMDDAKGKKVQEKLDRIRSETDIECVVRLWPTLPDSIKFGIVAMVRAASTNVPFRTD